VEERNVVGGGRPVYVPAEHVPPEHVPAEHVPPEHVPAEWSIVSAAVPTGAHVGAGVASPLIEWG
jgi:hypothetical protein